MNKIKKYISPNNLHSKEFREEYQKDRVLSIKQNFCDRKKELMKFQNESIKTMEEMLAFNNFYYIKERTFFTEFGDLFYADFFIPELYLVIEIDGGYHNTDKRKYLDKAKELLIADRGIPTVRIKNEEVFEIPAIMWDFLMTQAEKFWEENKDSILDFTEAYGKWRDRNFSDKIHLVENLKCRFNENLKNFCTNCIVEEVNKAGEVLWVFEDIFDYHFKTGVRFKRCLEKFNTSNNRWKTRLRFQNN